MKMKQIFYFVLLTIMIFQLSGCGNDGSTGQGNDPSAIVPSSTPENQEKSSSESENANKSDTNSKILIAYFSMPETTDPNNMTTEQANSTVVIDGKVLGNTEYVAQLIQESTGADVFRIEPKTPYTTNHKELVDLAKKEQNNKARPELSASVENIEQYDIIFLGYPNWWADMPMVLYTFLESYDFSGKTIIPFNTHGGSGFSNTIQTIAGLQPNATVDKKGFTVSRNNVQNCKNDVTKWINDIGLSK